MNVRVWGARGSIPAPGPETARYGGNTSCVQVTLRDGTHVVLDAGTGIRNLGLALPEVLEGPLHILLTHLHLDHIQGLMFFAPMFKPDSEIVIWGPAAPASPTRSGASTEASLEDRIARYISAPLTPVEIRELPCHMSFREAEPHEWQIGSATINAASVTHRGPTLGYRISDEDASVCYIPDHEPGLGTPLSQLEDEWISGIDLARNADLLIHDCQYTDEEYPAHLGWGHSSMSDALEFGMRAGVSTLALFHHDPLHSDAFLDDQAGVAQARWATLGGRPGAVCMAREQSVITLGQAPAATG